MINLLPEKEKKVLIRERNWKIALVLEIIVLIFFISFASILFSIKARLASEVKFQKAIGEIEEKRIQTPEMKELQEKINNLSQNISEVSNFYKKQINLADVIEKVSEIIPREAYLHSLSYAKINNQIGISGFSPNRDVLLKLKKDLSGHFDEVYFPPSNWVKPKNIDFEATFKLRK